MGLDIGELEWSINNVCNLRCEDCGFLTPNQPKPFLESVLGDFSRFLRVCETEEICIKTLVVVGGEPTLAGDLLTLALAMAHSSPSIAKIQVVTNGLSPQTMPPASLRDLDELVISRYFESDELINCWEEWLQRVAPATRVVVRDCSNWDRWGATVSLSNQEAQHVYSNCWYRLHCLTFERSRLFACSRIAKLGADEEGLLITEDTRRCEIEAFLRRPEHFPSCARCAPMVLGTVPGGVQPDNRMKSLEEKALEFFHSLELGN
jgi:hypothetical protein